MSRQQKSEVVDLDPSEAYALQQNGAVLLDVREDDEWRAGHAPEALHVPLSQVEEALAELQGKEVLAICRSGGRSSRAAAHLADAGVNVRNVAGGMSAWNAAGLPVVRDDGSAGTVA